MTGWAGVGDNAPDPRLDDRVLELLSRSAGTIAFNGLRRALGAHPESLSRALRRLERDGSVRREPAGYSLTVPGPDPGPGPERLVGRTVASVQLPPGVDRGALFGLLAGRWSGPLRWVGVFDRPGDPWLAWSLDGTQGHVLLSVRKGALRILVDLPRTGPDGDRLERAADDLLLRLLERLRTVRSDDPDRLATFEFPTPVADVNAWWNPPVGSGLGVDMGRGVARTAS